MNKLYITLIALLATLTAVANDSQYYTCGNQLVPMQNTSIAVQKEVLTVNLTNNGYTNVEVYYEFRNSGEATDILMGFEAKPPYFDDNKQQLAAGPHPDITRFAVEMNGEKLPYTCAISQNGLADGITAVDKSKWKWSEEYDKFVSRQNDTVTLDYAYVYSFKAHFKPGVNIVRHTYTYKESCGVGHTFWIDYKLTPATRWANRQIDDFTLRINAKGISKHFMVDASPFTGSSANLKIDGGKGRARMVNWSYEDAPTEEYNYYELSLRNATAEWHATNFRPQSELYISSADNMIMMAQYGTKINVSEGGAFAESIYYDGGVNYSPQPLLPRTKSKSLNRRICRNLPFAARGYKFKDLKLKKFFESQWWYIADPAYNPAKDKTLNALDKKMTKGYFNKFF